MSGLTAVLSAAKALHAATPGMQGFAPWKGIDPMDQNRPARVLPALDLVKGFDLSGTSATQPLIDAICASADLGHWIQTYTEAEVGRHFLDNYGYYELIGPGGHFLSDQMAGYVVYMPPGCITPGTSARLKKCTWCWRVKRASCGGGNQTSCCGRATVRSMPRTSPMR